MRISDLDEVNKLIEFNNINYDQIELMDINSKTIYMTDQFTQYIRIDYLTTGVYFLKISNDDKSEIVRFMITNFKLSTFYLLYFLKSKINTIKKIF